MKYCKVLRKTFGPRFYDCIGNWGHVGYLIIIYNYLLIRGISKLETLAIFLFHLLYLNEIYQIHFNPIPVGWVKITSPLRFFINNSQN